MTAAMVIAAAACTDAGCVRARNEDACAIVQPACAPGGGDAGDLLAVVADGMGGHRGGAIASDLAVRTIRAEYCARVSGARAGDGAARAGAAGDGDPRHAAAAMDGAAAAMDAAAAAPSAARTRAAAPGDALEAAVLAANRAIFDRARSDRSLAGMGTTCAALACAGGAAHAVHVGDSRIYLIRGGAAYRMTNDDSTAADRSVLLKALGTHPTVVVSRWSAPLPVRTGDRFVMCTDGLTELVADEEIARLATAGEPAVAAEQLIAAARERGGFDNITAVVINIEARGCAAMEAAK